MNYNEETELEEATIELYEAETALRRKGYAVLNEEVNLADRVNEAWLRFNKAQEDFFDNTLEN